MGDSSGDDGQPLLRCYNRGCAQDFRESENTEESCRYHPGTPYFHDAYKVWTCCNRRSVDFTEFLNMKGCATGFHSNVKPPEPEKKATEVVEEVVQVCQPKYVARPRPPRDAPVVDLKATMSESLKRQTYDQMQSSAQEAVFELKVGFTQCVNKGCPKKYEGPQTDAEDCKFHPGQPIFHEGLKYWSCCMKKTTDFEVFMKQEGCTTGKHLWQKPKDNNEGGDATNVKCRNDWHQDGKFVHVVVYGGGKKFDPAKSSVKANEVKLETELYFPEENSKYQEKWILAGIIVPEESSVFMTPMKVEIKLRKAEVVHWKNLNISEDLHDGHGSTQSAAAEEEHKSVGVEPLDLSDL